MAHDISPSEPLSPTPPIPTRAQRYDGWTTEKQVDFLRMLAATQSVAAAARSVGMGRQSAYKLRARLSDQPFGAGWRMAMHNARDTLVEAAIDRAVNGVEVPHFWKGEMIGTSRRFDERLTTALLRSGAIGRPVRLPNGPEHEFAQRDLSRLLERIAHGPIEWCDLKDERDFAWGDSPYSGEIAEARYAPFPEDEEYDADEGEAG